MMLQLRLSWCTVAQQAFQAEKDSNVCSLAALLHPRIDQARSSSK